MAPKKFIHAIPFLVTCIILVYTWYVIISLNYSATLKQQIGLGIGILNLSIYIVRFKYGIIGTGLLLLLATFDFIVVFPVVTSYGWFIRFGETEIKTPSIEWRSLLLLILYFILNTGYLINLYHDYKVSKSSKD
jgi:hypothetical protein